eukprot:GEZU01019503.1.p1 GENE.GEZU01019503.1~~GEZU01019503.1.p1  ORF type:complete len:775 (-),score=155.68 GEZU01019503.1:405-2729(-)
MIPTRAEALRLLLSIALVGAFVILVVTLPTTVVGEYQRSSRITRITTDLSYRSTQGTHHADNTRIMNHNHKSTIASSGASAATPVVSYDNRALIINGQRTLILSGSIHYPRSTPSMWPQLMKQSVAAGLNTIETYVFWGLHEPQQGQYNFNDRLDLLQFIKLAQEHNLYVILRIGPYICAEINYGGFPQWLRTVPGIEFRTYNQPFMDAMKAWVAQVVDYVRPQLASNGGNIIFMQIENEYGNVIDLYGIDGLRYQKWCIDMAESLATGIPWSMCVGSAGDALSTVNGFYGHQELEKHWLEHPDQPGIWTENWPGWYDDWAFDKNLRPASDVAYAVARFFAQGGSGMNYYMWHGGTNWARDAGYLITTSYDYDSPLDEYGNPHQPKYDHLVRLHALLNRNAELLVVQTNKRPEPLKLGSNQYAFVYSNSSMELAFLCNDDEQRNATVTYGGKQYDLPALAVIILENNAVAYDSSNVQSVSTTVYSYTPLANQPQQFAWWAEPLPGNTMDSSVVQVVYTPQPVESLTYTKDQSDYTWYQRSVTLPSSSSPSTGTDTSIRMTGLCDMAYVYIDGVLYNSTVFPIKEERGKFDGNGYEQTLELRSTPLGDGNSHNISILTVALGLVKIEGQIGGDNLALERKGLWGEVYLGDTDITTTSANIGEEDTWLMQPQLVGELMGIYKPQHMNKVQWNNGTAPDAGQPLLWWSATFDFEDTQPQSPIVLDMMGMKKGMAFINGHMIGRYFMTEGLQSNSFPPLVPEEVINNGSPRTCSSLHF